MASRLKTPSHTPCDRVQNVFGKNYPDIEQVRIEEKLYTLH